MPSKRTAILVIRSTALLGAAGAACFLLSTIVVNLLQPEQDPASTTVSEPALGEFGVLMTTSLWLHGAAILALAIGLAWGVELSRANRFAAGLMAAGGAGVILLGFFPTDPVGGGRTTFGTLYLVFAGAAFSALALAFLLLGGSFRRDPHWGRHGAIASALAWMVVVAFAAFGAALAGSGLARRQSWRGAVGAAERLVIGLDLAWILVTALRLRAVACDPEHLVDRDGVASVH